MKRVRFVGEVLPHYVYLGFPALEDGEGARHVLHPLVTLG